MSQDEIRLRIVLALIANAPQGFDTGPLIERARTIEGYVMPDNPPKRGPGRPPKQVSIDADNA